MPSDPPAPRIRIGISACLLGQEVRYDGGHKRDSYILGTLGRYFGFVPLCPEVAIGLGVPRETIRLVRDASGELRAVGTRNPRLDVTERLADHGRQASAQLAGISGYLLKKDSPSCGMERVKVYEAHKPGPARHAGRGIYAGEIMARLPLMPVEEEGRLGDPLLRECFLERVFVYHRWQGVQAQGFTAQKLVDFHTAHELLVMAHSHAGLRRLGRLVAEAGARPPDLLAADYARELMAILKRPARRGGHVRVLHHLMRRLQRALEPQDRQELQHLIERYRLGRLPLIVPLTLLQHYLNRHPDPSIAHQHYLNPHPDELMLRNWV